MLKVAYTASYAQTVPNMVFVRGMYRFASKQTLVRETTKAEQKVDASLPAT